MTGGDTGLMPCSSSAGTALWRFTRARSSSPALPVPRELEFVTQATPAVAGSLVGEHSWLLETLSFFPLQPDLVATQHLVPPGAPHRTELSEARNCSQFGAQELPAWQTGGSSHGLLTDSHSACPSLFCSSFSLWFCFFLVTKAFGDVGDSWGFPVGCGGLSHPFVCTVANAGGSAQRQGHSCRSLLGVLAALLGTGPAFSPAAGSAWATSTEPKVSPPQTRPAVSEPPPGFAQQPQRLHVGGSRDRAVRQRDSQRCQCWGWLGWSPWARGTCYWSSACSSRGWLLLLLNGGGAGPAWGWGRCSSLCRGPTAACCLLRSVTVWASGSGSSSPVPFPGQLPTLPPPEEGNRPKRPGAGHLHLDSWTVGCYYHCLP